MSPDFKRRTAAEFIAQIKDAVEGLRLVGGRALAEETLRGELEDVVLERGSPGMLTVALAAAGGPQAVRDGES